MIEITSTESQIKVKSPYYPRFIAFAKKRNGKWVSPHWVFDKRDEQVVRDACREYYGTAGEEVPLVTVRCLVESPENPWYDFGRLIAERRSRDSEAKIGEGVVIIEGDFPSWGGSVKHPSLAAEEGTVIEIRDVPLMLAKANPKFSIVGDTSDSEKLLAIAQIREIMNKLKITPEEISK
jgi:hypothetical protein